LVNRSSRAILHGRLLDMTFTIYARGPIEEISQPPTEEFEIYGFGPLATYEILPSGVLLVDTNGDSDYWVLAPDRWQWVKSDGHEPGEIDRDLPGQG
jgi:hypothetical protein